MDLGEVQQNISPKPESQGSENIYFSAEKTIENEDVVDAASLIVENSINGMQIISFCFALKITKFFCNRANTNRILFQLILL